MADETYTWNFLDARTKTTISAKGETFADAVAAAGYVNVLGDFYKKGEEPKTETAPPADA